MKCRVFILLCLAFSALLCYILLYYFGALQVFHREPSLVCVILNQIVMLSGNIK